MNNLKVKMTKNRHKLNVIQNQIEPKCTHQPSCFRKLHTPQGLKPTVIKIIAKCDLNQKDIYLKLIYAFN